MTEADEDHVPDGRRHEPGQEHGQEERSHLEAALDHQHSADDRPAEQGRDRRERAGRRHHRLLLFAELHEARDHDPCDRAERDQRRLGAEHRPERERSDRGERDSGAVRDRDVAAADSLKGRVSAVTGEEPPGDDDHECADRRKPDHEVPGRRRGAERARQVVPEPVLEVVYEREEHRRDQGPPGSRSARRARPGAGRRRPSAAEEARPSTRGSTSATRLFQLREGGGWASLPDWTR